MWCINVTQLIRMKIHFFITHAQLKLIVICNNLYMACNVKCQCKYDQFRHDFSEGGWICDTQYFAYDVYLMCIKPLLELLNDDLVIVG